MLLTLRTTLVFDVAYYIMFLIFVFLILMTLLNAYVTTHMGNYDLAAPVHQMQQYYRLGALDNCYDKWSALFDCLRLKTKQPAEVEEALKKQGQAKPHIWTFRTPEEATVYWNKLFGQIINKKK
nr:uncharacterized protein LOC109171568 [Ipomoea trifida]